MTLRNVWLYAHGDHELGNMGQMFASVMWFGYGLAHEAWMLVVLNALLFWIACHSQGKTDADVD